jgi:hypothetical protein
MFWDSKHYCQTQNNKKIKKLATGYKTDILNPIMARPKRYKTSRQFSLRMDAELLDQLEHHAARLGVDRSQLINRLLALHVEENPFATDQKSAYNTKKGQGNKHPTDPEPA